PVEADQDVPPIPEIGPLVDLLSPVHLEVRRQPGRDAGPGEAEDRRLGPVLEVVRGICDHVSLAGAGNRVRNDLVQDTGTALAVDVVAAVELRSKIAELDAASDGIVRRGPPAESVGA